MTLRRHVVYLGDEPDAVLSLVDNEVVDSEVTVSVLPSAAAALSQVRSPRTDCLVVDDAIEDPGIDEFLSSLAEEAPQTDVVLRVTGESAPALGTELDPVVLRADAAPDAQWERLAAALAAEGDTEMDRHEPELGSTASTFSDSLQWYNPDPETDRVKADSLANSLANTPTVVDTFLNNILDIFFVFDMNLNFRLWNDRFNAVTGFSDEEIASMSPLEFIVEEHHERALNRIEQIIEDGQATAEFDLRMRDGTVIPYSFTGSLIDDEDGLYISGIGRDISDRKEREMELRRERDLTNRIVETSPMAIFVMDADGSILRANSRARNVLGITKSDVPPNVDESDWTLYDGSGDRIPYEEQPIVRALETGETVYGFNHLAEMPNGEKKWLSKNAAPLTDEDGNVSKVVVAIEDITDVKEHEQELARRKAELDEAVAELRRSNAELERFAYVASHDLKEPLRMISNYLGLLERRYRDELDEDAQDFIDYATDGAERMRDLINGLLKYSRTQRQDDPLEPVDCTDILDTVQSNLEMAIEEADAEVRVDDLPVVLGHRNHLVQLFQNLISNAITYSGEDPPRIDISVERSGEMYEFAITDNGVGIEDTSKVFDIFYSGGESDSTGIGLAICQKIVENHGGRIDADSEPGEGTTFSFTLPAESAEQSEFGHSVSSASD